MENNSLSSFTNLIIENLNNEYELNSTLDEYNKTQYMGLYNNIQIQDNQNNTIQVQVLFFNDGIDYNVTQYGMIDSPAVSDSAISNGVDVTTALIDAGLSNIFRN